MRSIQLKKKKPKTRKVPFKSSFSPFAMVKRSLISFSLLGLSYLAALWILVPLIVYALTALKSDPLNMPTLVGSYCSNCLLDGWATVTTLPLYETPAIMVILLVTFFAVILALYIINQQFTSKTLKNIFGPAASKGNEKGSARLMMNELELADVMETWNGDWSTPPKYPAPIMGYSQTFGYYLLPKETHSVVFGIPGAGKSTKINYGTIDAIAAGGASLIITDPKGELYGATAKELREHGVDVYKIDFRNPESSNCYNPLTAICDVFFRNRERYLEASREALCILETQKSVTFSNSQKREAWQNESDYEAYMSAIRRADAAKNRAWSEAEAFATDLATAIVPERENAGAGMHWEDVARITLTAIIMFVATYTEDDYIGDDGKPYTEPLLEQRTLETVHHLLREYGDIKKGKKVFETILKKIDHEHPAWTNFAQIRTSEDKEYKTGISETIKFLDKYLTRSVNAFMNRSDFDLASIGTKQTAVYIVLPDERPARGRIFAIFATQLYQALVDEGNKHGNSLPVPVHCLLEEFGNLPFPIPDFANKLAMSRALGVYWHLTLQGMNQLPQWYGGEIGQMAIFDQCGVKTLLKTTDAQKCGKYFSTSIGNYTYAANRVSKSRETLGLVDKNQTFSSTEEQRPMLYPDEITRWNYDWGAISLVSKSGKQPGFIAKNFFNYKTMQTAIFPLAGAYDTPTAYNLDIGTEKEVKEKIRIANQESRLDERIPNTVWNPVNLDAQERIALRESLKVGSVSVRAQKDLEKLSVKQAAHKRAYSILEDNINEEALFNEGEAYIDTFVSKALKLIEDENVSDEGEVKEASSKKAVELAAITGILYDLLTRAMLTKDASILKSAYSSRDEDSDEKNTFKENPDDNTQKASAVVKILTPEDRVKAETKYDRSWVGTVRKCLSVALSKAQTQEEYIELLKKQNITVELKNNEYFYHLGSGNKKVGADKAGDKYCYEDIQKRFNKSNSSEHHLQPRQNSPDVATARKVLKGRFDLPGLEAQMAEKNITFDEILADHPELISQINGKTHFDWKQFKFIANELGLELARKRN